MDADDEAKRPEFEERIARLEAFVMGDLDFQLKSLACRQMLLREEFLYTRKALLELAGLIGPEIQSLVKQRWEERRSGMLQRMLILVEDQEPGIAAALSSEFEDELPE